MSKETYLNHKRCSIPNPTNKYKLNTKLPIYSYTEEILSAINNNSIVIISGKTGCGKTTQIPQLIYNSMSQSSKNPSIVITQPRRVAVMNIAKRLSKELGSNLGELVGYHIGMNPTFHRVKTKILIKTTGIFLEELIHNSDDLHYTHVILDEVHERDINIDLVLVMMRDLLMKNKKIKLILMSATIQTSSFAKYFSEILPNKVFPPIIEIKEQLNPVDIYYLDKIMHKVNSLNYKEEPQKQLINQFQYEITNPYLDERLFRVGVELLEEIQKDYEQEVKSGKHISSVLVFLPGIAEIIAFKDYILGHMSNLDNIEIFILHSNISDEEQSAIFRDIKERKIILSTNIAESSITIPNNDFVIDFCLVKEIMFDQHSHRESLELRWASRANCEQRGGRTGRTGKGRIFRLIPEDFYNKFLSDFATPEILRTSLEKVILKVKIYDCGEPKDVLSRTLNPPELKTIKETIKYLHLFGALTQPTPSRESGNLTEWGRIYAELPIDIRYSKLIMISYAFDLLESGIVCAAILSQDKKLFKVNKNERNDLYESLLFFSNKSECDIITAYLAFKQWESKFGHKIIFNEFDTKLRMFQLTREEYKEAKKWCQRHLVDMKVMRETLRIISDIKKRLNKFRIYKAKVNEEGERILHVDDFSKPDNILLFKIILCGAFYDKIFKPGFTREKSVKEYQFHPTTFFEPEFDPMLTLTFKNIDGKDSIPESLSIINQLISPEEIRQYKYDFNELFVQFPSPSSLQKFLYISKYRHNKTDLDDFGLGSCEYIFDLMYVSVMKLIKIEIDPDSINKNIINTDLDSILLTRYVTDEVYDRNMKTFSRYVSKLPSIKMFDLIIFLVFCPQVEFFANEENNQYEGFLLKSEDKEFTFPYLFSVIDLNKINELRSYLSQLFKLKRGNDSNIALIEDEYQSLTQKLKFNFLNFLKKKRFKVISRKEYKQLFKQMYGQPFGEDPYQNPPFEFDVNKKQFCSQNFLNIVKKDVHIDKEDLLPTLKHLPIKQDFRFWIKGGEGELETERKMYNNLKAKVIESLDEKENIINHSTADVYCGRCQSYICSVGQLELMKNFENQVTLFKIGGWVTRSLKDCQVNSELANTDPFALENKSKDFTPDCYALCESGKHIIGIKIKTDYYATTYSDLRIEFPMNDKRKFTKEMWNDNFAGVDKIMVENTKKRQKYIENNLDCVLCNFKTNKVDEFRKHLKEPSHKYAVDELNNEVF